MSNNIANLLLTPSGKNVFVHSELIEFKATGLHWVSIRNFTNIPSYLLIEVDEKHDVYLVGFAGLYAAGIESETYVGVADDRIGVSQIVIDEKTVDRIMEAASKRAGSTNHSTRCEFFDNLTDACNWVLDKDYSGLVKKVSQISEPLLADREWDVF